MTELGELLRAARERQSAGAFAEAAELWRELLWREPRHTDRPSWAYAYAEALRHAGEEGRAAALFARMQRVYPDRPEGFVGLALMHQGRGAHDHADALWRLVLERWPTHKDRRWWLAAAGFALIELGELEAGEELGREAVTAFGGAPGGSAACSLAAERRFRWTDALSRIDEAIAGASPSDRPQFIASKARILRDMGATADCRALLAKELAQQGPSIHIAIASAQFAETTGPMAEAAAAWDRCLADWPEAPEGVIGWAQLHRRMGETGHALSLLRNALARWPARADLHQHMAETLAEARRFDEAEIAWQEARKQAPSSLPLLQGYCRFLGARGADDLLEKAIVERAPPHAVALRCRYEFAKAGRDLDASLARLMQIRQASPSLAVDAFAEAEIRSWRQDPGDLEEALRILRALAGDAPAGASVTALLIRVLVLLGQPGEAQAIIATWPHGHEHMALTEALIWSGLHTRDADAAKARWQDHASRFFVPALHLPRAELRAVRQRPDARGGLVLISIIRNELPRLPRFLDHHRKLGITQFVIVDNGSEDGSLAYLEAQPDVSLYTTAESYAAAVYGVRWLNQLIDTHGHDGWVIHADADERLVYEACEDRPLTELARLLAEQGDEIVPAVMIDMFALPGRTGGTWFDPPRLRPSTRCPLIEAAGGARRRLFGTTVMLSKAPMIRAAAGIRYLSVHETTPGSVSGVRMALLHDHLDYVLSPENLGRVREEVQRGQHSDFAVDRRRMLSHLQSIGKNGVKGPESLRYKDSRQLLRLGLITAASTR